jgi:flagellar hook protein FlgE
MSINGALNSAVSGLSAQATAMAVIADNLANSETYGYKAVSTSFSTLVTEQMSGNSYSSGGVRATPRQAVGGQGLIESSNSSTHLALDGNGMFACTDSVNGNVLYFTRNGEFSINQDGYMVNGSYYLQGWELDQNGKVAVSNANSASSLSPINLSAFNSSAAATDEVGIQANLPASATVGDTFTTAVEVYDSLGTAHTVSVTWTKTAANEWSAGFSDPTLATDNGTTTGTISGGPITITFDGDGLLDSYSPNPASIGITGWTTGASDSTIALDLGTSGKTDGLTQYAPDADDDIQVSVRTISQNGLQYGTMNGVEILKNGTVVAHYDNGDEVAIYKIPVSTFTNYNGLTLNRDGFYEETYGSGNYTLNEAGTGSAGEVSGSSLEASTVDTADEFSKMIVSQQAYSAASQMISTCDDMYDDLMSAVR